MNKSISVIFILIFSFVFLMFLAGCPRASSLRGDGTGGLASGDESSEGEASKAEYEFTVEREMLTMPDGKVSLVSGTLINPADRNSRLAQAPLTPGTPVKLTAEIHYTTWRFRPGHRIRIAVGNAQFPMAWPTPYKGSTTLFPGKDTWVQLPVVTKNTLTGTCHLPKPEEEEWPPDASYEEQDEGNQTNIDYNSDTGDAIYSCGINQKMTIRETTYHTKEQNTWKVNDNDPAHATYESELNYIITPPDREIHLKVNYRMASDEKSFNLMETRQLLQDGEVVREKKWSKSIPRKNQ